MSEGSASLDDGWFELWKGGMLSGEWEAYRAGVKAPKPTTNDGSAPAAEPKPGDEMDDGTVYAGSLNGRGIYTTPRDAPLTYTFKQAAKFAEKLNREKHLGHDDWRVPTKNELNVLFNNRAAIGGFNQTGREPAGWYWSFTEATTYAAWAQRFSDGTQSYYVKDLGSSLRCVRG